MSQLTKDQVIVVLNNLNMEGRFNENSSNQYENINTARIRYTDSLNLSGTQSVNTGNTITIYNAIDENNIIFVPTSSTSPTPLQFTQDGTSTANNLITTLNNLYKTTILFDSTLYNSSSGSITLYYYNAGSSSIDSQNFVMTTAELPNANEFRKETDANTTATNLSNVINNHSAFTSIIDVDKNKIEIYTSSPINISSNNSLTDLEGIIVNNFYKVFINNIVSDSIPNEIIIKQKTSKKFQNNSTTFDDTTLSISNFIIENSQINESAISSESIGTYQLLSKIMTDISFIKSEIINNSISIQNILSAEYDSSSEFITFTSLRISNFQSVNDKTRGDLLETTDSTTAKPLIFSSTSSDNTVSNKYSEDAIFEILKVLYYEILKFSKNITVNNLNAGFSAIPSSISSISITPEPSQAPLRNIASTLNNLNKEGTISETNDIATAIPSNSIGLIQLINEMIMEINLIKLSIQNTERDLLNAIKTNDLSNISSNLATKEAINNTLKVRGNYSYDISNNITNNIKPSIYTGGYSEDAVFGFFSCISYELMKLLNCNNNSNNNSTPTGFAGIVEIPASVEDI